MVRRGLGIIRLRRRMYRIREVMIRGSLIYVWESAWIQQMCDNVTWHVFETPPTKVLDLGCGTGSWILECAKRWKQCHFVGLDLVPLQPDLKRVGSSSMASRITWVQANFLECLPFPNEEFDFVHIKRIARGVPEDKWDALFDEVTRVMKPGGAFEMLEEDLYWPGQPRDADGDSDSESGSSPPSTSTTKVPSPLVGSPTDTSARSESPSTPRPTVRKKNTNSITPSPTDIAKEETKSTPGPAPYRAPSPKSLFHPPPAKVSALPNTPGHAHGRPPALTISTMPSTPSRATVNNAVAEGNIPSESSRPSASTHSVSSSSTPSRTPHSHRRTSFSPSTPTTSVSMSPEFSQFSPVRPSFSYPHLVRTAPKPPVNPRDHTILETIYTKMHAMRFINLAPLSLLPNNLSTWFKDVRTHPPLNITFPPPPVHPRVRSSLARPDAFSAPQTGSDDESGLSDFEGSPVRAETAVPRGAIFRRTHSTEDSQTTIRRKSLTPTTAKPASPPIISLQGLILGVSPYAYLDDARFTAFSPSGKASFMSLQSELPQVRDTLPAATAKPTSASTELQSSSQDPEAPNHDATTKKSASLEGLPPTCVPVPSSQSAEGAAQDLATTLANFKIRLPNTTLRLDLRTLNLHLAARTSEILACTEAMWEWVLEFQAEKTKWKQNPRLKSNRVDHSSSKLQASAGQPEDPIKVAIAELTRAEFDGLLTQFNLDMRDHYALGSALEERFAWSVVPMPATQDRKLFDIACDKWEQYQRQQRQDQITESKHHPYRRHNHHSQLLSEAATTLSSLPTIPDTITMRKDSTRPAINFTEAPDARQCNNSGRRGGRQTLSHTGSYTSLHKERALPEPLDEPHPSYFLCRTMRVFVAWKP
ncbi:hypothetical protein PILCRDRAFT_212537 [Piloderma croceum F 1598]|uniref:Methyltransferase domain-containing protein n=1 Tax=Piloderma croceum (strain F 1598) TaxID=765440 RepID=A0A0C3FY63_PILCF|nr:hypothetical protein PILCRDRAFT_212537 [Piloderma croceum F 1598]